MIYLENYKYSQYVRIPKAYPREPGPFSLVLRSTIDNTETTFSALADESTTPGYYGFTIKLGDNFQQGEYIYEVRNADRVLATGLAEVIFTRQDVKQYEQDTEYKQYEG